MFEKIKIFIKNFFGKQKLLEQSNNVVDNITENESNDFKEKLREDSEIYNLQKLYEEGKITEDDLQICQIKKLIALYKKQNNYIYINSQKF